MKIRNLKYELLDYKPELLHQYIKDGLFIEGYAVVSDNIYKNGYYYTYYSFLDTNGNILSKNNKKLCFLYVDWFSEGFACVQSISNEHYGFINKQGNFIIVDNKQYPFDDAENFINGFAGVKSIEYQLWGFLKPDGTFLETEINKEYTYYDEDKNGVVNKITKSSTVFVFTSVKSFNEGFAPVENEYTGWWTYIDTNGKLLFKKNVSTVHPFNSGYGIITDRNIEYLIDTTGKITKGFESIIYLKNNTYVLQEFGNKRYYINVALGIYSIVMQYMRRSDIINDTLDIKLSNSTLYIYKKLREKYDLFK